ncbi:fumarylacetoacetase [Marinobacterium stanieri]|uniref:fumarylacetoacetase n=1 Tax=Marinobacterium stanieri TaxID=49186 RepID=UPI003A8CCA1E
MSNPTTTTTTSWINSANGHPDFPLQNLPLGIFSLNGDTARGGVAIGDQVLDIKAAVELGLFEGEAATAAKAASEASLNHFFSLSAATRKAFRAALTHLLQDGSTDKTRIEQSQASLLHPQDRCTMHLPASIGDYTDFYVGIHHANNVGKLFRPDNPLLPNYKHVPIGYHGRASSIVNTGTDITRPKGQTCPPGADAPQFGPSKRLDFELELGIWIGTGNEMGQPIPISDAPEHFAGLCLLNDWSARDIQAWEYQPLGPFLAKNFASTVSPWVITAEALEPFRTAQPARPEGDPQPLPYLLDQKDQQLGAFDIQLEVLLCTEKMRNEGMAPVSISVSNSLNMYWSVAQMIAHHTVGGCNLRPGDLLGSGTISGPEPSQLGSMLELTEGGKSSIELPSGETRTFLEDGDEVILTGRCCKDGYPSIGFGECRGIIKPTV